MREIKFRALGVEDDKWCIGSMHPENGEVRLDAFWTYYFEGLLKKETMGKYIGHKDKKGKEIYKGDIIKHKNGMVCVVSFCDINLWWYLEGTHNSLKGQDMRLHMCEVISNIHDNPELIK